MKATGWLRVCLLVFLGLVASRRCLGTNKRFDSRRPSRILPARLFRAPTVTAGSERNRRDPHYPDATKTATFEIPELPVGTYDVQVEARDSRSPSSKGVVVSIGHVASFRSTLQVGGRQTP